MFTNPFRSATLPASQPALTGEILLIEDNISYRNALTHLLDKAGLRVTCVADGVQGVAACQAHRPDLILCDVLMPRLNGFDVKARLNQSLTTRDIPFIFLTALGHAQEAMHGLNLGADDYLVKPIDPEMLLARVQAVLNRKTPAGRLRFALASCQDELYRASDDLITYWVSLIYLRDPAMIQRTERVARLTVALGEHLGLERKELERWRLGALLHDAGKLSIPETILHKPEPLTETEWLVMRQHPNYAYELLQPIARLRPALDIPLYHHEHFDGTGYPFGLSGEAIPLSARCFAVAEAWDARRLETPALGDAPEAAALAYLQAQAGRQFDPQAVAGLAALLQTSLMKELL